MSKKAVRKEKFWDEDLFVCSEENFDLLMENLDWNMMQRYFLEETIQKIMIKYPQLYYSKMNYENVHFRNNV